MFGGGSQSRMYMFGLRAKVMLKALPGLCMSCMVSGLIHPPQWLANVWRDLVWYLEVPYLHALGEYEQG